MADFENVKECSAKAVYGTHEPACSVCVHNGCPYYVRAKRDEMDEETDYEEGCSI